MKRRNRASKAGSRQILRGRRRTRARSGFADRQTHLTTAVRLLPPALASGAAQPAVLAESAAVGHDVRFDRQCLTNRGIGKLTRGCPRGNLYLTVRSNPRREKNFRDLKAPLARDRYGRCYLPRIACPQGTTRARQGNRIGLFESRTGSTGPGAIHRVNCWFRPPPYPACYCHARLLSSAFLVSFRRLTLRRPPEASEGKPCNGPAVRVPRYPQFQ